MQIGLPDHSCDGFAAWYVLALTACSAAAIQSANHLDLALSHGLIFLLRSLQLSKVLRTAGEQLSLC